MNEPEKCAHWRHTRNCPSCEYVKPFTPQSVNDWHDEDHRSLGTCCTCKQKKVIEESRATALHDAMEVVKEEKSKYENSLEGSETPRMCMDNILSALTSLAKE